MLKHVSNYFKAFGYDESDTILCEVCGKVAVHIHHVNPRSLASKAIKDTAENLCALCYDCHEKAHGPRSRYFKDYLIELMSKREKKL